MQRDSDVLAVGTQDCDRAVERDDHEFAAFFNRGNVEMRLREYGQALEDFRMAADLAPGISGARLHGQ